MAKTKKNATQTAKVKTYDAGQGRRVTVPENPKPEDLLLDAMRENFSPAAIVAISAYLQPCNTKDAEVNRQVQWFWETLADMIAPEEFNSISRDLGV